ncbi:MAG: SDR family oxidoreductase [Limisphaerales bacterium]
MDSYAECLARQAKGGEMFMRRKISDSVIVITGASSGIGRATALKLAKKRATIVLAARSREGLQSAAAECEQLGARTFVVPTDVTSENQVQDLARRTVETYGRIDAWINNAGIAVYSAVEETPSEIFRQVLDTNFFGAVYGSKAVIPYFREQGFGVLINVSSSAGKVGAPFMSAYSASKFALNGFTESIRMELSDAPGIHVCNVVPGSTDTPFFWHAANYTGRALKPVEPMLKPVAVANAIVSCLARPKREVLVGRLAHLATYSRVFPRAITERIIAHKTRQEHFVDEPEMPGVGNVFEPTGPYHETSGRWHELFPKRRNWLMPAAILLVAAVGSAAYLRNGRRS